MKTFKITYSYTVTEEDDIEIEAESEDEAKQYFLMSESAPDDAEINKVKEIIYPPYVDPNQITMEL